MLAQSKLFKFSRVSALILAEAFLLLATIYGGTLSLASTLEYCAAIAPKEMTKPISPYTQLDLRRFLGFLLVAGTPPALVLWILVGAMISVGKQIKKEWRNCYVAK